MHNIYIIIFSLIFFSCAPAPRYNSSESTKNFFKVENKKNKFNKNKVVYRGVASYYGPKFHGKLTAHGEVFDMYGVTAAHKEIPFNTVVRVTNLDNDKSLILRFLMAHFTKIV